MSVKMIFCIALAGIIGLPAYAQSVDENSSVGNVDKLTKKKEKNDAPGLGEHTMLWKITGNGLEQPSWLFGTMHILCADDADLSDSLKAVIKDCQQIYFEIDMDNLMEMMGAINYLKMSDGKTLSDLLTPEEYERLKAYFDEHHSALPLSMMEHFKPFLVASMIGEQLMTCEQKDGMEARIMKESKAYEKEIKGLETVAYQASIFDSIPYEAQAKELMSYIDSIDVYKKSMEQMVDVYREQDLDKIDSLTRFSEPGMNDYMDMLLYDRNRHWAAQMPAIMAQKTTLFAVGAGHLPGEQGVIDLLRKAGFTVSPVRND